MALADVPIIWSRDGGLVCLGFRSQGVDSKFVSLGEPKVCENAPWIHATDAQMRDPAWWRQWQLRGVVLWGSHLDDLISQAIKAAGLKLVVHLDTDGLCSPRVAFWQYLARSYALFRDQGRWPAAGLALLKTILFRLCPQTNDTKMVRYAERADLITINTPLAQQRFQRLLRIFGKPEVAERVQVVSSPLALDAVYDAGVPKRKQIVAAGRWEAYQKDAPRVLEVMARVLALHPEFSAVLIGPGANHLERLWSRLPEAVRPRVRIAGQVDRATLIRNYQESSIMLIGSRYESLHLATVEALACGCSLAGPAAIVSINYLSSANSGTLAPTRGAADLADAVGAEIEAWKNGERNPARISQHWRERFEAPNYARKVLRWFEAQDHQAPPV